MDWIALLTGLFTGLLCGAAAAAAGVFVLLRSRHDARTAALSEERALAQAAQAEAERRAAGTQGRLEETERHRAAEADAARERESMLEMLHPVRQGVTEVQRKVSELERERAAQHAQLSEQLASAAQSDARLLESTQALLGSLRSTTARGHWGEVQLRRVVEAAGMLPHVDFAEQHQGISSSGEVLRPDLMVRLPGERTLVIDAKAPLGGAEAKAQAKALRARVDELASKKYWEAVELSPEVVFCFVPAESLLSSALEHDPSLLEHAVSRGVTLVSPASLLAALKAVEAAWRQERLAANITEVIDHSRELYRRLETMGEHLSTTGSRLRQAVEAYNSLIGNIERRVMPQVEAIGRLEGTEGAAPGALSPSPLTADVRQPGPRLEAPAG
ncbi:DNA recombination protein RmuC [Nesterenkonia sp. NBAIMH1]|uniref:DNA recombination protein RmuC n=1 Tax=Nesterenkonia sp. NBAIMH1 TaxID=2600320 RepID=UPI00143D33DA|nr:DNA recombination protein RmuC [Nesterenkonia sp. NBAIMH1]